MRPLVMNAVLMLAALGAAWPPVAPGMCNCPGCGSAVAEGCEAGDSCSCSKRSCCNSRAGSETIAGCSKSSCCSTPRCCSAKAARPATDTTGCCNGPTPCQPGKCECCRPAPPRIAASPEAPELVRISFILYGQLSPTLLDPLVYQKATASLRVASAPPDVLTLLCRWII